MFNDAISAMLAQEAKLQNKNNSDTQDEILENEKDIHEIDSEGNEPYSESSGNSSSILEQIKKQPETKLEGQERVNNQQTTDTVAKTVEFSEKQVKKNPFLETVYNKKANRQSDQTKLSNPNSAGNVPQPKKLKINKPLNINQTKAVVPQSQEISEEYYDEDNVFSRLLNNIDNEFQQEYGESVIPKPKNNPSHNNVNEWLERNRRENEEKEKVKKEEERRLLEERKRNSISVSDWLDRVKEQKDKEAEQQEEINQDNRFHGIDKVFEDNPELLNQIVLEDTRSTIAPIESIEVEPIEEKPSMMELLELSETSYPDEWIETFERAQRSKKVNAVADKLRSGRFRINKEHQIEILADYKTNNKSSDDILSERWF